MPDITPSMTYLHDLKVLQTEYLEHRITDEEYSQRLDKLMEQEARLHKSSGPALIRQALANVARENELKVKENLRRKERERAEAEWAQELEKRRQRQMAEREQEKRETERINYRYLVDNYVNRLEVNARDLQRWYAILRIILVFFSAATAAMASIDIVPRWIVSASGFIAAIAGSYLATFQIQERIYANRKAVAELRLETQKYDYRVDEYAEDDLEKRFLAFSKNITAIQRQEMLQEVEFWNPKKEEKREERPAQTSPQKEKEGQEPTEKPEEPDQEEEKNT